MIGTNDIGVKKVIEAGRENIAKAGHHKTCRRGLHTSVGLISAAADRTAMHGCNPSRQNFSRAGAEVDKPVLDRCGPNRGFDFPDGSLGARQ